MHYKHISPWEREQMGRLFAQGKSIRHASRVLHRSHSSLAREIKRSKSYRLAYSALAGEQWAEKRRGVARRRRKLDDERLQEFVYDKLKLRWSPEQIAHFLKRRYADDITMQVSHESIYTYIYVLPRGELRKELISYLRQGRFGRQRRKRGCPLRAKIPNMVSIRERPKEVESRTIPGHWESDLVVGKDHASAIGTLVERTTRTTILVPLKAKDAETVRKRFATTVKRLPKEICLSLTHDRGLEMAHHELFTKETNVQVYFADPYSPWQRGTNENTNGLIRQFFPKGTDFRMVSNRELKHVQRLLNERPRKVLNWRTPKESMQQLLTNGALNV